MKPACAMVALAVTISTSGGCLCAGSPGVLVGAGPDVKFVNEQATLMVSADDGLRRIQLDGSGSKLLFPGHLRIHDVSADFRTFLLSDSETNLLVGDASTGALRPVPELAKRLTDAALSPDGTRIAAARHADFSLPQAQWKDADDVFLVDVATLAVEVIPASSSEKPAVVRWSADGSALWLTMGFEKPSQWITIADRARQRLSVPPADLRPDPRLRKPSCPQTVDTPRWKPAVEITDAPAATPRTLVRLEGRERGFHDYQADFSNASMSPACRHVVFEHRGQVWVADAATGKFGPLLRGDWLFFVPEAASVAR